MKMTDERWKEISEYIDNDDPLKDIDCDDGELIDYIDELRKQLHKKDDEA